MTARKHGKGWAADFYHQGKRVRKYGFATKSAAARYEQDYLAQSAVTGRPLDDRLSDLVRLWHELHGCTLKDENGGCHVPWRSANAWAILWPRNSRRCPSRSIARVASRTFPSIPSTMSNAILSAVFSELIRLGAWHGANPLAAVRQIKTDQTELSFP